MDGIDATDIATASDHTCVVQLEGSAHCWGRGSQDWGESSPPLDAFVELGTGFDFSCGVRAEDGALRCWGIDDDGQSTPPAGAFEEVVAYGSNACALAPDGSYACLGIYGDHRMNPSDNQDAVFDRLAMGSNVACGVAGGKVDCWGTTNTADIDMSDLTGVIDVAAGQYHVCALLEQDGIVCRVWHDDGSGIDNPPSGETRWTQLSGGHKHVCALDTSGGVDCWGSIDMSKAPGDETVLVDLAGASSHHCGITQDAAVVCWGAPSEATQVP